MQRILSSVITASRTIFLVCAVLVLGSNIAQAASVTEDFENVTIVDANGNELTSQWASGAGLSNGWKVINGTLYKGDSGDYQLAHITGGGWLYSDYFLSSSSTSKNDGYMFIPVKMLGSVQFFAKSNLSEQSKKTSTVTIYEATADGTVTDNVLYTYNPAKAGSWGLHTFDIEEEEGKYVAINLVYTDLDDFTYTIADGSPVTPTLTVSATTLDFGTTQEKVEKTFTVKSNVSTTVSVSLSDNEAGVFTITQSPTTLTANSTTTIAVEMKATEAGSYSATLTITAGELNKTVALTGVWEEKQPEQQPENWQAENFNAYHEGDEMPLGWNAEGWAIGEPFLLDTPAVTTTSGGTLITPIFTVTDNQGLQFSFSKTAVGWMSYSSKMNISYSTDKEQWTLAVTYDKTEADGIKTIALPTAGSYYMRFEVNDRTYLDDFLVVDVPTTGIERTTKSVAGMDEMYNLSGQRLSQKTKGLIIVNGKKTIVK